MRQGGLGIATFPVMSLSSKQLHFESQIVTVVDPAQTAPIHQPNVGSTELPVVQMPEVSTEPAVVPQVPAVTDSLVTTSDDPGPPSQTAPPMIGVTVEPVLQKVPLSARENTPPPSAPVWHNAGNPVDVDGTGRVAPLDVLIIANHLNISFGNWQLPPVQFTPPRYLDVNGDGRATPHDALLVVNYIESQEMPEAEGEAEPLHASEFAKTAPVSERPDHVDASLRDAGRITCFGRNAESGPQIALASGRSATDIVLRARRGALASWSEIEDILPTLAADWLHSA
jgi:hypothetical protein